MTGTLHICGTPLGNLEDLTFRALRILKEADVIAAEDTRHTLKLLNRYDVKKPLVSFHEHNWKEKIPAIIAKLKDGQNVALVTDAGMPCISDPGQQLVDACLEEGLPVTSAPGPTALATAVALSGFPSSRFVFEGFLPRDGKRAKILQEIGAEKRAVVLYEAPHHLKELLSDLLEAKGDKNVAVLRELTKIHEEIRRGTLSELLAHFKENEPKGEFVVILAPDPEAAPLELGADTRALQDLPVSEHMNYYLKNGMDKKEAMKLVAKDRGVSKSAIYSELLSD